MEHFNHPKLLMNINKSNNYNPNYNYGLALFRMLMCFEVILMHYCMKSNLKIFHFFDMLKELAVPTFMFLSFYLTEKIFVNYENIKIKKRLWRVIYPQIGWTIIYWIITLLLQVKADWGISFADLLWQLFTGHSAKLNPAMWFQVVLIILTLFFSIVFKYMSIKKGILILSILTLFSFWFQYTGLNYDLFTTLRYELKYPIGRFFETIPYASLGFFCAYFNIYEKIKKISPYHIVLFGIISLIVLFGVKIIPSAPGFGYSNNNNLFLVFFMVGFVYFFPFGKIPFKIRLMIKFITKYTLGIYCMHNLIGLFLNLILPRIGVKVDNFIICIFIYVIAFYTSFIMCKLSPKFLKQLVE